jgi:membrane associated rhomboid family serine protease
MSITEDIKFQFKARNVLMQIIIVNIAVFLLVNIFALVLYLAGNAPDLLWKQVRTNLVDWIAMPYDIHVLLHRPWTIFTHFFTHVELWHIFSNMLWLFFFGRIFVEYTGQGRILSVFVYGALAGALLSFAAINLIPNLQRFEPSTDMIGASAGVMAVALAAATLVPNRTVRLFFLGDVPLKYIAAFFVIVDIISLSYYSNSGGHFAHLGGALFGFIFVSRYKAGRDWSKGFNKLFDVVRSPFRSRSAMTVIHNQRKRKTDEEFNMEKNKLRERVDEILDKISRSGYESLTKEEKEILFKSSDKI